MQEECQDCELKN